MPPQWTLGLATLMLMTATVPAADAPAGTAPFCLKTSTGRLRCTFATMGACEEARTNDLSASA